MAKRTKKTSSQHYMFHLTRALIAFVGVTTLSWSVWKLLDHFFGASSTLINAATAGLVAVVILALDHFRLREIE